MGPGMGLLTKLLSDPFAYGLESCLEKADPGQKAYYCQVLPGHPADVSCAGISTRPHAGHPRSHWEQAEGADLREVIIRGDTG